MEPLRPQASVQPVAPSSAPQRSEPLLNLPGAVIAAIAICVGVHLVRVYLLTSDQDLAFLLRAAFIPLRYSPDYQLDLYAFTSPITYSFLHGGWVHLVINMIWLAAFGSPLANRIGAFRFALFWIATSLGAVALHFAVYPFDQVPLVGASGAISGMMGAAARFGFRIDRTRTRSAFAGDPLSIAETLTSRLVLAFLGVWLAVNLISGLGYLTGPDTSAIAWEAHIGGFVIGFFAINLFVPRRRSI